MQYVYGKGARLNARKIRTAFFLAAADLRASDCCSGVFRGLDSVRAERCVCGLRRHDPRVFNAAGFALIDSSDPAMRLCADGGRWLCRARGHGGICAGGGRQSDRNLRRLAGCLRVERAAYAHPGRKPRRALYFAVLSQSVQRRSDLLRIRKRDQHRFEHLYRRLPLRRGGV